MVKIIIGLTNNRAPVNMAVKIIKGNFNFQWSSNKSLVSLCGCFILLLSLSLLFNFFYFFVLFYCDSQNVLTYLLFAALQIPLANHLICTFPQTLEVPCNISIASHAFHVEIPFIQLTIKSWSDSIRGVFFNDLLKKKELWLVLY